MLVTLFVVEESGVMEAPLVLLVFAAPVVLFRSIIWPSPRACP